MISPAHPRLVISPDVGLTRPATAVSGPPYFNGKLPAEWRFHIETARDVAMKMNGVGVAWPQIGVPLRIFLFNPDLKKPRVLFNASYRPTRPATVHDDNTWEGCLSLPGVEYMVPRPPRILATYCELVKWWSGSSRFVEVKDKEMFGWEARVFQHECDHLDGVLIDVKATATK